MVNQEVGMMMKNIKIGFRGFLSLSLILTPCYGYTADENTNNLGIIVNNLEEQYTKTGLEVPPEFHEAANILLEMGDVANEGRLQQYLQSHPELKDKFDVVFLSNQEVVILDYAGNPISTINFDSEKDDSRTYKRNLQNIEIEFDQKGRLLFKGVIVSEDEINKIEKKIGLIHKFEDIKKEDVIDWAYDGEVLALLHKQKGLILYHMMFVRTILGSAPVPSILIPSPQLTQLENAKLEFIDRSISTPTSPSHSSVPTNLNGESMFFAGDLLVSTEDSDGTKNIELVFSRSKDLVPSLFKMYLILGSLLQIRGLIIENATDIAQFESNISYLERHLTEMIQTILSATLNGNSLSFFVKFEDIIEPMKYFLVYKYISKNRDVFIHSEWLRDYETLRENFPDLFTQRSDVEGRNISSGEIAKALAGIVETKEEQRKSKIRQWFDKKFPDAKGFWNENKFFAYVAIVSGIAAIWQSSFIPIVGSSNYTADTVNDIVFLGVGFLLILGALGTLSVPILRIVRKTLRDGELKVTIDQMIEKWSGKEIKGKDKLTAFGFKLAAVLLPLIYRIFQFSGQPHLFSALNQGLNPIQRVTPESHLGKESGVDSSRMLLGLEIPRWRPDRENYQVKSRLIETAVEQKTKIETLSKIMTYYALSNKPFDMTSVLSGPLSLDGDFDHEDRKLMRDFIWISQELSQHITKLKNIDTTRPILEWDAKVVNEYYEKALNLAQEVQHVSWSRKQRRMLSRAVSRGLREILNFNVEHATILMNYYPNPAIARQFWYGLIMDHLTLVEIPLTSLTPRGDYYLGNVDKVALEPYTFFRSSDPHMHEAGMNILGHGVGSARQQLQYLVLKKQEALRRMSTFFENLYEPIEQYINKTENEPTAWQYIVDFFKYPGSWGEKIYEGTELEERVDVGWQLWRQLKLVFRFWTVTVPIGILSREFFTDYSFSQNVVGTLFFNGAGLVIFALPQIWVLLHHIFFNKKAIETKEIIDGIKLISRRMNDSLYDSERSLNDGYEQALYNFRKLYQSSKKLQVSINLDDIDSRIKNFLIQDNVSERELTELVNSQSLDEKRSQIRNISVLFNTPHLPTMESTLGFQIALLGGLGIYSNIAFVFLSERSFGDATLFDALWWISGAAAIAYLLKHVTAKTKAEHLVGIKEQRGDLWNRVRSAGTDIKNKCAEIFKKKE